MTTTQNEMLQLIYDPRNRYIAMEDDPLDSKDLMHGVPREFKDIFDQVTQDIEAAAHGYDDDLDQGFVREATELGQLSDE